MLEYNAVYHSSAEEMLPLLDENSVDLTVTSPPYDDLRTYKGFAFDYIEVIDRLYRVTKLGGIVVWVVGDGVVKGRDGGTTETGTSFKHALTFMDAGFNLHDTMIYEKNGAAYPASAKSNRYSQVFEYMFVFSKGKPKTTNLIKDKPNRWAGHGTFGKNSERLKNGEIKTRKDSFIVQEFGYRNNIWRINNGFGYSSKDKEAYNHPAIFPEALAEGHIITWSNPGDLVLDPFAGSGTTLLMAKKLGREYLGCDISEEYCNLALSRLEKQGTQLIHGL